MKNATFLATLAILTIFVNNSFAQDENMNPTRKGRFVADIDFGFTSSKSDLLIEGQANEIKSDIRTVETDIEFGYTVIDNLSIGIGLDIETEHAETDIPAGPGGSYPAFTVLSDQKLSIYSLHANYHFMDKKFKPLVGLHAGFAKFTTEDTNGLDPTGDNEYEGSGWEFGGRVGLAYFFNDHIGFNVAYKIDFLSLDNTNTVGGSRFNSTSDFVDSNIIFGVSVAF